MFISSNIFERETPRAAYRRYKAIYVSGTSFLAPRKFRHSRQEFGFSREVMCDVCVERAYGHIAPRTFRPQTVHSHINLLKT